MSRFGRSGNKVPARKAARSVSLQLEALEDRIAPTAAPTPAQSPPPPPPPPTPAATTTPTPTTYTVKAGDVASLIADINAANAPGAPQTTINLTAGTYDFTKADNTTSGPNALPVITGNIIINGNGAVLMRDPSLGQGTPFRFFDVAGANSTNSSGTQSTSTPAGTLALNNVTLYGGAVDDDGSGNIGGGGGILNQGTLQLNGVTMEQNAAVGGVSTGTFSAQANFGGGAILNLYGTTTLINCTLASNLSTGAIGSGNGGALFNIDGTVNVNNSTLANNAATAGGAIYNFAMPAPTGTSTPSQNAIVNLTNSILSNSISTADVVNDGGNNLGGQAVVKAGSNNIIMSLSTIYGGQTTNTASSADPKLGPLFFYGGSTQTMPLQAGSPALGAGISGKDSLTGLTALTTDQRGSSRGSVVDLGSYQVTSATAVPTTLTVMSNGNTLTATVSPISSATQGGIITFKANNTVLYSVAVNSAGQVTFTPAQSLAGQTITVTYTNASGTAGPSTFTLLVGGSNGGSSNSNGGSNSGGGNSTNTNSAGGNSSSSNSANGNSAVTNSIIAWLDSIFPQLTGVLSTPALNTTTPNSNLTGSGSNTSTASGATPTPSGGLSGLGLGATPTPSGGLTGSNSNALPGNSVNSTAPIPTQISSWLSKVWQALYPGTTIDQASLTQWANVLESGVPPGQVVLDMEQTPTYRQAEIKAAYNYLGVPPTDADVQYMLSLMNAGATMPSILALIAGSDAFFNANGGTNQSFLNALYKKLLAAPGVDPTSQATLGKLLDAGVPRWEIAMSVSTSPAFLTELVLLDYKTYINNQGLNSNILQNYADELAQGKITNDNIVADLLASQYTGPVRVF